MNSVFRHVRHWNKRTRPAAFGFEIVVTKIMVSWHRAHSGRGGSIPSEMTGTTIDFAS
jgi:hypothetical protein